MISRSDELLTVAQVADLFQVSKATVRRRVREGKLTGIDTAFGLRFRAEDVQVADLSVADEMASLIRTSEALTQRLRALSERLEESPEEDD